MTAQNDADCAKRTAVREAESKIAEASLLHLTMDATPWSFATMRAEAVEKARS